MASHAIPSEYAAQTDELSAYFQKSKPQLTVHNDWDFNSRCVTFRFDEEHRVCTCSK